MSFVICERSATDSSWHWICSDGVPMPHIPSIIPTQSATSTLAAALIALMWPVSALAPNVSENASSKAERHCRKAPIANRSCSAAEGVAPAAITMQVMSAVDFTGLPHRLHHLAPDQHPSDLGRACADLHKLGVTEQPPDWAHRSKTRPRQGLAPPDAPLSSPLRWRKGNRRRHPGA